MAKLKPYTVIFYVDGDRAVETFVERVMAQNSARAWDAAVRAAKKDGGTTSGYSLDDHEWENATEIVTFSGHADVAND